MFTHLGMTNLVWILKINNFENLWTNKTKYVEVYDLLFAERKNLLKYSAEWAVDLN